MERQEEEKVVGIGKRSMPRHPPHRSFVAAVSHNNRPGVLASDVQHHTAHELSPLPPHLTSSLPSPPTPPRSPYYTLLRTKTIG